MDLVELNGTEPGSSSVIRMNETFICDRREVDAGLTLLCDQAEMSPAKLNSQEIPRIREALSEGLDGSGRGEEPVRERSVDRFSQRSGPRDRMRSSIVPQEFPGARTVCWVFPIAANTIRRCRWFLLASVCVFLAAPSFPIS